MIPSNARCSRAKAACAEVGRQIEWAHPDGSVWCSAARRQRESRVYDMRPLGPTLLTSTTSTATSAAFQYYSHLLALQISNSPPTFYEITQARDSSRSLVQIVAYCCCQTSPGSCQVRARCPCCAGGSTAISRTAPTAKTLSALRERVNAPLSRATATLASLHPAAH